MAGLNKGDRVTIRADLKEKNYGQLNAVGSMLQYAGKKAIIVRKEEVYRLDIDEQRWQWSISMFEDINFEPQYEIY